MDPLDDLLRPAERAAPDAVSRRRLLDATTRELRRHRKRRRLSSIASLAGAYAAGILSVLAVQPPDVPSQDRVVAARKISVADSGADLEWRAIDEPGEAPVLYREAGHRYLADDDPADAVRCYGNALDAGSPEANEVKPDDNWLLMAIKVARRKEAESCER